MTEYWGHRKWYFMHQLTYNYPKNTNKVQKEIYKKTFIIVTKLIPCDICKSHFIELLKQFPIEKQLGEKELMITWLNKLHNCVNKRLSKPIVTQEISDKIYSKSFNHKLIYQYLKYNADRAIYGHILLQDAYILFRLLNFVYPCLKCRNIYQAYYKAFPLENSVNTQNQFKTWYLRIFRPNNVSGHLGKEWKKDLNNLQKKLSHR